MERFDKGNYVNGREPLPSTNCFMEKGKTVAEMFREWYQATPHNVEGPYEKSLLCYIKYFALAPCFKIPEEFRYYISIDYWSVAELLLLLIDYGIDPF